MFYNFELESLKYLSYIFVPYTLLNIPIYKVMHYSNQSAHCFMMNDLVFEVSEQRMVA